MASRTKARARSKSKSKPKAARRPAPRITLREARPAKAKAADRDLLARLAKGAVVCAEGYLFELERRGYLQAGAFVPEVLFEHPEVVEQLHMDFVHAGSDVTEALTYYVHREKLRVIGREKDLVPMNRAALGIAKAVARKTGTLFAGDLCNTNIYDPADKASHKEVERIFAEQVGWAEEAGVDFFVAETFSWVAEAVLALEAIRKHSKAPAVITMAMHREDVTREGLTPGGGLPAPRAGRCRRRGAELSPRTCDDHADDARDSRRGEMSRGGAAGALPHDAGRALVHVAHRPVLRRRARLPGGARSVRVHAPGDLRFRPRGLRARHPLPGRVLRSRAASYPCAGREPGAQAAGEPLYGGHVPARLLRQQPAHQEDPDRLSNEALKARRVRYSALALLRGALTGQRSWTPVWRSPEPKRAYDALVVGGGGHGLATAYYLAKNHGIRNVAVLERGWIGGGNTGRNTTDRALQLPLPGRARACTTSRCGCTRDCRASSISTSCSASAAWWCWHTAVTTWKRWRAGPTPCA